MSSLNADIPHRADHRPAALDRGTKRVRNAAKGRADMLLSREELRALVASCVN